MQAVILAGGLATRLRPLTEQIPKCMINIQGKPFLRYQLELLKQNGINRIILCLGYLSEQIERYFKNGEQLGLQLTYSLEEKGLLGTGGALRKALPFLDEEFLVLYGDSYLDFPYSEMLQHFYEIRPAALMLVYRNQNRWDKSNVVLENGYVRIYDKSRTYPGMVYIDAGLSVLTRKVVQEISETQLYDLAELYHSLADQKRLPAFEIKSRFYEVGSPAGLKDFAAHMEKGGLLL